MGLRFYLDADYMHQCTGADGLVHRIRKYFPSEYLACTYNAQFGQVRVPAGSHVSSEEIVTCLQCHSLRTW